MTTNNPEVVAYHHINKENPEHRGVSLHHDASCTNTLINTEPLIRLSDYEALQAECEKLRKDADRLDFMLNNWRKVVAECLPGSRYEVYVEEGFMGDKSYPAVTFTGSFEEGIRAARLKAIDEAMRETGNE